MAKPKKTKSAKSDKQKLLERIRDRFTVMVDADRENRQKALADLKFLHVPGEQWDAVTKTARGPDRPCLEFNKLRVTAKRIVNDMRSNRPQGKVRGVEDSDKDTAEVMEGLIRNIWNVSDGDTVIDYAGEYQVGGGMGAWRIDTEYSDNSFSQDIKISAIKNPFCLYADPAASDPIKRDAEDWILTERITKAKYEANWPDADVIEFEEAEFDDSEEWQSDDMVRICEYWWREPYDKTLWQLADGKVIDAAKDGEMALQAGAQVVKERTTRCHKIMMCIASGESILEGPTEWAGAEFPFVQVYGEWVVIDGKTHWFGITRFGKDAQRAYNYSRTAIAETVAMSPRAKFWATPEQAKGHTEKWGESHQKGYPFLLYNADPKTPGPPAMMAPTQVPVALIQESQMASDEIKAVTGIFDNSLGQQANETSGRAIQARQKQGEIATYNYADNMGKAIRRTWEILIGLVPAVYDTERTIRTLGVDGAEKYVKVNTVGIDPETGQQRAVHDLGQGKFDVTVTVGPSYATQRQEASETFIQIAQATPEIMQVAGDLIFKSMDVPLSEQFAERMKFMLPPPIQESLSDGKPPSPESQAAMAQADQMMQEVQQHGQMVQKAAEEAEKSVKESEAAKAEIQQIITDFEIQKAQFEVQVTKELAKIELAKVHFEAEKLQAGVELKQQAHEAEQEVMGSAQEIVTKNLEDSANTLTQLAEQFSKMAEQVMTQLQEAATKPKAPTKKSFTYSRGKDGSVKGEILEDAGA